MFFGQAMQGDATFGSIFDDYAGLINEFPSSYPSSNGGYDGGGSWWDTWGRDVINQGFGIGSQIISGWSRNPTQQVGAGGSPIGQGYSPSAILQANAQQQAAIAAQQQALLNAQGVRPGGGANSLDGIAASITSTISNNPLIFAGLGVGLYLLFREPPRRR